MLFDENWSNGAQVAAYDLGFDVQRWMGGKGMRYATTVEMDVRVLPDTNKDMIRKPTKLEKVCLWVVPSTVPAVVLGGKEVAWLRERVHSRIHSLTHSHL